MRFVEHSIYRSLCKAVLNGMVDVSVIIPAYNERRHISRCLDSLLRQNFDSIEVLVVDDGSTDGTAEIVKKYLAAYPGRFRLVRLRRNTGSGNARNIGALYARGRVVVFLDADMEFPPTFLSSLVGPILDGISQSTCPSAEIIANIDNPWVMVQGQRIRGVGSEERTGFVRAIERELFIRSGGFDASFGYFDDQTLHRKTGITSLVVKDAVIYHHNPDTVREILWRNFWMGRSVLRLHKPREVAVMTVKRLLDLSALAALFLILTGSLPQQVIGVALLATFALAIARHRVLETGSISKRLLVKLFYTPVYRFLKAAGFIGGLLYSLAGRDWARIEPVEQSELTKYVTEFSA